MTDPPNTHSEVQNVCPEAGDCNFEVPGITAPITKGNHAPPFRQRDGGLYIDPVRLALQQAFTRRYIPHR